MAWHLKMVSIKSKSVQMEVRKGKFSKIKLLKPLHLRQPLLSLSPDKLLSLVHLKLHSEIFRSRLLFLFLAIGRNRRNSDCHRYQLQVHLYHLRLLSFEIRHRQVQVYQFRRHLLSSEISHRQFQIYQCPLRLLSFGISQPQFQREDLLSQLQQQRQQQHLLRQLQQQR